MQRNPSILEQKAPAYRGILFYFDTTVRLLAKNKTAHAIKTWRYFQVFIVCIRSLLGLYLTSDDINPIYAVEPTYSRYYNADLPGRIEEINQKVNEEITFCYASFTGLVGLYPDRSCPKTVGTHIE